MQRKKWLIVPFVINLMAIVLTQLTVPAYDFIIESNPVNNFFYQHFGSFIFAPFITIFVIFIYIPILTDIIIKKTHKGENYRRRFEWIIICIACCVFLVDFMNNLVIFLSL